MAVSRSKGTTALTGANFPDFAKTVFRDMGVPAING